MYIFFKYYHFIKDMFQCELLQAVHGGLLELHQTLAGTWVLHLDLPLTLLCKRTQREENISKQTPSLYLFILCDIFPQQALNIQLLLKGEIYLRLIKQPINSI